MAQQREDERLGDELVKRDLITREELNQARQREHDSGVPWIRQLIQLKKINFGPLDDVLRMEFHTRSVREQQHSLGKTLVEMGAVSKDQLQLALDEQKRNGRLIGNILLDRGIINKETKDKALARQSGLEFSLLDDALSEQRALEAVPESMALKNQMIPITLDKDKLSVLISDPRATTAIKDASVILGLRIHPIMTSVEDIREEIISRYAALKEIQMEPEEMEAAPTPASEKTKAPPKAKGKTKEKASAKGKKGADAKTSEDKNTVASSPVEQTNEKLRERLNFNEIAQQASGAPVIKLVQTIIEGAVNSGATDIHLDPQEPEMRVRYRIDGVLHDVMTISNDVENAVVSRIKIMSDMDITETRHPQDGHISIDVGERELDIRVATLPTYLGERVVLRLLDQSAMLAGVKDLGLEKDDEEKITRLIEQPYGMILVTGPTGSGKTTTLYAALNQKNVVEDSIVTLEDPVEYQLSGINQVQIDTDIGVTFANTLRAALRQDIDVLLVGEIRDADTARIAIRASMTGHLVFSTLHTNDAPEAISTLRNMDVPSYLIASALTCIIAQRLVRKICPECRTAFAPTKALLQSVGLPATVKKLYRGAGCEYCYHTGNKGRTGIFELIELTPDIRRMIAADEATDKVAKSAKLKTMADRCRQKLKDGIVAPEEFLRVIRT